MTNFSAISIPVLPIAPLAFIVFLTFPVSINAQTDDGRNNGRAAPSGVNRPIQSRPPSIRERQFKILEMEREAAKARTPEEEKLALAEIAEDFQKIQLINNKMMGATMHAVAPDYARIMQVTAEIKMRANRLKENMRLAKDSASKEKKGSSYKTAHDAEGIKASLLSLDDSIMSFVQNPVFKNPGVVDVQQANRASRDLETIIEVSNLINKDAQRLSKAAEKTH